MSDTQLVSTAAAALAARFALDHPVDAANRLEEMTPADAAGCVTHMPLDAAFSVWPRLASGFALLVFRELEDARRKAIIEEIDSSRAASLLAALDDDAQTAVFAALDPPLADILRQILSYPEDSAGRAMDTRVFSLHGHVSIRQASDLLRRRGGGLIQFIKIVDEDSRLISQVDVRAFATADPDTRLETIAVPVAAVVSATDPREYVVEKFEASGLQEIPVIDFDGRVIGIIRHDRLVGALRDEASVDMQTMVGASKDERALSTSWFAVRKRMPWLQINLLTAFLAAAVVGLFEPTIAKFTALAVLLPVVAGQSGNAGAQALAVTMRGLALREINVAQWFRVLRKEMNAGFWNGIGIAVSCAAGVYLWSGSAGLVLVIVLSMIISMVMAGLAGALVPIVLTRLGQDPAVASSIVLTTVTDVAGFFSFLGIATLLAGMLG